LPGPFEQQPSGQLTASQMHRALASQRWPAAQPGSHTTHCPCGVQKPFGRLQQTSPQQAAAAQQVSPQQAVSPWGQQVSPQQCRPWGQQVAPQQPEP
jgi:hypothetical protein